MWYGNFHTLHLIEKSIPQLKNIDNFLTFNHLKLITFNKNLNEF